MEFIISEQLAQAILGYLATKPYQEVVSLISGLQQIKRVNGQPQMQVVENSEEGKK